MNKDNFTADNSITDNSITDNNRTENIIMDHNAANMPPTDNFMQVEFSALERNTAFARTVVASFVSLLNPTLSEVTDIKTAVSEAVSNAVIHGYCGRQDARVVLSCAVTGKTLRIQVRDLGVGIDDVKRAREPLYTTRPEEERSGMGFTVMEMLMDRVEVESRPGRGTVVTFLKTLGAVDRRG